MTTRIGGIIMPIYKLKIQFMLLYFPISLTVQKGNTTSYSSSSFLPSCSPLFHILNSTLNCLLHENKISDILVKTSNLYLVKDTFIGEFEVVDLVEQMNYSESHQNVTKICLHKITSTNKSQDTRIVMFIC